MKRFIVTLALIAGAGAAGAQPAQRAITFEDAIGIALRQNTAVRQAQAAVDLSGASVAQARMNFLPEVRLNVSNGLNVGRNFDPSEGRVVDQTSQSLSTGISSSVTLFDGFRNTATLNSVRAAEDASMQDLARTRQTVVFTVASNFLSLVAQQEQLRVHEENLAAQELLLAQVETFVKAGSRPISDLYQQQASVAAARSSVVDARRALELAKVDLIGTLRLDPAQTYAFVPPAVNEAAAASRAYDLDALVARALQGRVDLQAQQSRVESAEQGTRAAEGSRYPSVSLSGGYNTGYNSSAGIGLGDQLNDRRGGSLSIGVSIPIFDRGATSLAAQRAQIQEENAKLEMDRQRQQVALDVRRAYLDLAAAQERLKAAEAQKAAADQAVHATQERYRVGASTMVELTQVRAGQTQAASALVNARYTLVFQDALMSYYTGELDPQGMRLGD